MIERKLRFALFGKEFQDNKLVAIRNILTFLSSSNTQVAIDRAFHHYLTDTLHLDVAAHQLFDGDDFEADFAVSVGGDGTFLQAASRVGAKGIPIIGINTGRLGFLADVLPSEIESAFGEIMEGNYRIENHAVIEVSADGKPISSHPFALNDIAVLKRDNASMISIRTCINGEYLVTYQADGLIISTPTGSTAYGLSNGGPIIVPDARNLCITPVAPHSLNVRPIVINDDSVVTLEVESRSHNFLVAIDGRSEKRREGERLTIRKAPFDIRIVKRPNQRYFSTLREKMMWGIDQR
ncbi:MAG: NAD kinase [Prevotella sp.]